MLPRSVDFLRIDINSGKVRKSVSICQNDTLQRTLSFSIVNSGVPINMADLLFAEILIKKPDGYEADNGCVIDGDSIQYTLRSSDISAIGQNIAQLMLTFSNGEVITTPTFEIVVYSKVLDQQVQQSLNEYTAITQQLVIVNEKAAQVAEDTNTASNYATAAQTSAENASTSAEFALSFKESAEASKEAAEDAANTAATDTANALNELFTSKVQAATGAADAAEASATDAASSAQTATQKATDALTSANQAAEFALAVSDLKDDVIDLKDETAGYVTSASGSANAAASSATAAQTSANSASSYATSASGSASAAASSATDAATSATAASNSADAAAESAREAAQVAGLELGETSDTAYRGDRGKAAYDHSQTTGNPHQTTAAQVGADTEGSAAAAYQQAAGYTDAQIAALINGAPETLNTLKEIADAMAEYEDVVEALQAAIGSKAAEADFQGHASNTTIHITSTERTLWNGITALTQRVTNLEGKIGYPGIQA